MWKNIKDSNETYVLKLKINESIKFSMFVPLIPVVCEETDSKQQKSLISS